MKRKLAFTMIEILIVVGIISLLSATAAVSYRQFMIQSRIAKRKADLEQLKAALELYKSNNGNYPTSAQWAGETEAPVSAWRSACEYYGTATSRTGYPDQDTTDLRGYIPALAPTFIQKLPHDPKECTTLSGGYTIYPTYLYRSDGTRYKILAYYGNEGAAISLNDPYYDSKRPTGYTYQVSSDSWTATNW